VVFARLGTHFSKLHISLPFQPDDAGLCWLWRLQNFVQILRTVFILHRSKLDLMVSDIFISNNSWHIVFSIESTFNTELMVVGEVSRLF
jgi:hypothetical protein